MSFMILVMAYRTTVLNDGQENRKFQQNFRANGYFLPLYHSDQFKSKYFCVMHYTRRLRTLMTMSFSRVITKREPFQFVRMFVVRLL